jgi:hypothetical protein
MAGRGRPLLLLVLVVEKNEKLSGNKNILLFLSGKRNVFVLFFFQETRTYLIICQEQKEHVVGAPKIKNRFTVGCQGEDHHHSDCS